MVVGSGGITHKLNWLIRFYDWVSFSWHTCSNGCANGIPCSELCYLCRFGLDAGINSTKHLPRDYRVSFDLQTCGLASNCICNSRRTTRP